MSQLEIIINQAKALPPSELIKLIKQTAEILEQNNPPKATRQAATLRVSAQAKVHFKPLPTQINSYARSVMNGSSKQSSVEVKAMTLTIDVPPEVEQ